MAQVRLGHRDANTTSWRELYSTSQRKYYFNTVTKTTTYEMPAEYRDYLESRGRAATEGKLSKEQCDEIFFNVLRERAVRSQWTWEEALRAIIDHPEYKIVPTLLERKAAFQRFQGVQAEAEREERKMQGKVNRQRFQELLAGICDLPERWSQVQELLHDHPDFKAIETVRERVALFDEFVAARRRNQAESRKSRRRVTNIKLMGILSSNSEVSLLSTRWRDVPDILSRDVSFQGDADLRDMSRAEMLSAWEDWVLETSKREELERQAEQDAVRQAQRDHRDAFRGLLLRLRDEGRFAHGTAWDALYNAELRNSPVYLAAAGATSGSTPLDIYFDLVDEMQVAFARDHATITEHIKGMRIESPSDLRAALRGVPLFDPRHVDAFYAEMCCHDPLHSEDAEAPRCDPAHTENAETRRDPAHAETAGICRRDPAHVENAEARRDQAPASEEKRPAHPSAKRPAPAVDVPAAKKRYPEDVLRRLVDAYKSFVSTSPLVSQFESYEEARAELASASLEFRALEDEDRRKYYFEKALRRKRDKGGAKEEGELHR